MDLPNTTVYVTDTPGAVYQARLLENQEGADSANSANSADFKRYVLGTLSPRCLFPTPNFRLAPVALFQLWGYRPWKIGPGGTAVIYTTVRRARYAPPPRSE